MLGRPALVIIRVLMMDAWTYVAVVEVVIEVIKSTGLPHNIYMCYDREE